MYILCCMCDWCSVIYCCFTVIACIIVLDMIDIHCAIDPRKIKNTRSLCVDHFEPTLHSFLL
jgi:hypothetical protein